MKREKLELDFQSITSRLLYDPNSGLLTWKRNGKTAGHYDDPYVRVRVNGILTVGHRLAWLLHYGFLPDKSLVIDHINRNGHDNRISNLRVTSHSGNLRNSERTDNGGACFCKQTGQWKAYYVIDKKQIWLGRHDTKEKAFQVVREQRAAA